MAKHQIYTFYATLDEYEPKVWRRFEINGTRTMAELAYATMILFEMQASHLFSLTTLPQAQVAPEVKLEKIIDLQRFRAGSKKQRYEFDFGEVYVRDDEEIIHPNTIRIKDAIQSSNWCAELNYDYGDDWYVQLQLESVRTEEISLAMLPRVLAGEGFGIIEDVGGVSGLTHLAKTLKKGKGQEYEAMTQWLGSTTLDLGVCDIADLNFRLKKLERVYRNSYQLQQGPSDAMIDILTRAYLGKGPRGY